MSQKAFARLMGMFFPLLFLLGVMAGCARAPQPIKSDEIPEPTMAKQVSHAEAWNLIFFPWPIEKGVFTEGPFKGFEIETTGESMTGYKIYVHRTGGYFRPEDIETHYERKLVTEWYGEDKWQRLDNFTTSYHGWAWKRGRQVFIVVCAKEEYIKSFHTYLISK